MKFGILHLFLILLLLLAYLWTGAQDYVVTSRGDTITGEVKPLLFGLDKKVQVTSEEKKKTTYPMFQVQTYSFKNELYQPVKGPDGYTFMKLVKSGYLSLYYYQLPNQMTFDGSFLMRKDGKGMDVPNIGFKKSIRNFLSDCKTVADRVDNGELSKKDLGTIIDQYNECIQGKTDKHDQVVAEQAVQEKVISAWDVLETKVKEEPDFEGKVNSLEMIQEIKGKVAKSEKIPNFLLEGLKNSLKQETLQAALADALKDVK
ncbi:MAG: hypothetical protein WKF87_18935 [Chryseolinea sp.]